MKSKGHVCFFGRFEFFRAADGSLFRGTVSSYLGVDGYRADGRFECAPRADGHAAHMAACYGVAL